LATPWLERGAPSKALDAVSFLIDAVISAPMPPRLEKKPKRWNIRVQFLRVLEIFERLERAEQFGE
jgi:15-cis-phytoene synthase